MANETTSTTDVPKPINAMFTRRFLERAAYFTHYMKGTDGASIVKHGGTATGLWRRVNHITPSTTALTELTGDTLPARTAQSITVTDVTTAVSKYGQYLLLTEEADVLNFNGHTAEYWDVLAEQAGRTLNMVQRNEMEDNATAVITAAGASVGVAKTAIVVGDLDYVINTLAKNVASTFLNMAEGNDSVGTNPILPSFIGICHPDVAYNVSKLSGFKSVESYAGQVDVMPNEFGYYGSAGLGVRFMSSPDSTIDSAAGGSAGSDVNGTSAAADIYNTVIYGRHAVGSLGLGEKMPEEIMAAKADMAPIELIHKPFGSSGVADALNELSSLGWKSWGAAKILNGDWIRCIRSAATDLSN